MNNVSVTVIANALMALAACTGAMAQVPEARFLPFGEELKRARTAIGREAECRVLVEELFANCELVTAGNHFIRVHFSDVFAGAMVRKTIVLGRGEIEPQKFASVLATYGIPTEVTSRCLITEGTSSRVYKGPYETYVGDFALSCDRDSVTLTYARKF